MGEGWGWGGDTTSDAETVIQLQTQLRRVYWYPATAYGCSAPSTERRCYMGACSRILKNLHGDCYFNRAKGKALLIMQTFGPCGVRDHLDSGAKRQMTFLVIRSVSEASNWYREKAQRRICRGLDSQQLK